jgi:hypothetical protein
VTKDFFNKEEVPYDCRQLEQRSALNQQDIDPELSNPSPNILLWLLQFRPNRLCVP